VYVVRSESVTAMLKSALPGVAWRLVTLLLRQKNKQKRQTRRAAFCFVVFVVALFLLPSGRRTQTRSYLQLKSSSPRSSNMCSPTSPARQQK
jgi:hypothetical protein